MNIGLINKVMTADGTALSHRWQLVAPLPPISSANRLKSSPSFSPKIFLVPTLCFDQLLYVTLKPIDLVFCLTIFEEKIEEIFNEIVYIASLGLLDVCGKIALDLLRAMSQPTPS